MRKSAFLLVAPLLLGSLFLGAMPSVHAASKTTKRRTATTSHEGNDGEEGNVGYDSKEDDVAFEENRRDPQQCVGPRHVDRHGECAGADTSRDLSAVIQGRGARVPPVP